MQTVYRDEEINTTYIACSDCTDSGGFQTLFDSGLVILNAYKLCWRVISSLIHWISKLTGPDLVISYILYCPCSDILHTSDCTVQLPYQPFTKPICVPSEPCFVASLTLLYFKIRVDAHCITTGGYSRKKHVIQTFYLFSLAIFFTCSC